MELSNTHKFSLLFAQLHDLLCNGSLCCDCDLMIASTPLPRDVNRESQLVIMKIIDRN